MIYKLCPTCCKRFWKELKENEVDYSDIINVSSNICMFSIIHEEPKENRGSGE